MAPAVDNPVSVLDSPDQVAEERAWTEGEAHIAAGRTISHEAMRKWLLSWGKPDELPPPECDK
jgi:predicted transcriptional regulator